MKPKLLLAINFIVIALLLGFYGIFLARKIDLTTADLGRHIENGKLIIHGTNTELRGVLYTNFYSYTMADEPFINHHWLSGVVFYLIYLVSGFKGLSVFYVLMGCATLYLFFDIARKKSNLFIASIVTIALTPLIASRAEVRPEMFTYLFSGVFLYAAQKYTERKTEKHGSRLIWFLPLIMLLWVNLHIGFVFGFLILAAFGMQMIIYDLRLKIKERQMPWLTKETIYIIRTGILCVLAGFINPNFIKGFLYPLSIFKNYGYLIVENQSIKFLENLQFTQGQHFLLFKIVLICTLISFILAAIVNWRKINIALLILTLVTGYMAYNGIRHFPSFGFFALVALASNIWVVGWASSKKQKMPILVWQAVFIPTGLFIMVIAFVQGYQTFKARSDFGLGLMPKVQASAEFFEEQNVQGPIFNDYDIGGYLIFNTEYHGSREQKDTELSKQVFVDNRPEAYSVSFFEEVYKPTQADESRWKEMDEKYNFNAIFFSHRDYTPWAQNFLISRVKDKNWAVVFVDGYNIIYLKRNLQNEEIIKKYEIPKERFGISQN